VSLMMRRMTPRSVAHWPRRSLIAGVVFVWLAFGALAFADAAASAAATFPSSPMLDNFATDTSLNTSSTGWTTPALGEGGLQLDPVAHELTGPDHGGWDAALWNAPFASPVEVWATINRAGTNTASLYANITGGESGTLHPTSGYFAAFSGSNSGSARDEVSLWRIDNQEEKFMTAVPSPYTDLHAGDAIGLSVSKAGVVIAWYKPLNGSWKAAVSWQDGLYSSGKIAVEAIPGADYGLTNFGGGTPTVPVASTITTTSIRSSTPSVTPGQTVTYTATVSPTPDGGTVSFADAGVPIPGCAAQTVNSSGNGTCAVTYNSPGSHIVSAVYSGSPDGAFAGSTNGPDATLAVVPPGSPKLEGTSTRLSLSNATPAVRSSVLYTASVKPTPDGGIVSFTDFGAPIQRCASQTVQHGAATCKVTYATPGAHQIRAFYRGDEHFGGSDTAAATVTVSTRPSLSIGKQSFIVTVVCPAQSGGCRLISSVAVTIRGVKKAIGLKRLSARLKAGKRERFTFRLNGGTHATLRSDMRRHHAAHIGVTVHIIVRDGNGASGSQTFTFNVSGARDLSRLA
jgi:plastocyanin